MDHRERDRLKDEIDKGTLDAGIYKLEEGAYQKESRLPLVKGGTAGFVIGGAVAATYGENVGFSSPLGLFVDDYVLVMIGMFIAGTVLGALLGWAYGKLAKRKG
jgi:hypothetical protein